MVPPTLVDFTYNELFGRAPGPSTYGNILGRPQLDFGSLLYVDYKFANGTSVDTLRSFINPNDISVYMSLTIMFKDGYSRVSSNDFSWVGYGQAMEPVVASGTSGTNLWVSAYVKLPPRGAFAVKAVREQLVDTSFQLTCTDEVRVPIPVGTVVVQQATGVTGSIPYVPVMPKTTFSSWKGVHLITDPFGFSANKLKLPSFIGFTTRRLGNGSFDTVALRNDSTLECVFHFSVEIPGWTASLQYSAPSGETTAVEYTSRTIGWASVSFPPATVICYGYVANSSTQTLPSGSVNVSVTQGKYSEMYTTGITA